MSESTSDPLATLRNVLRRQRAHLDEHKPGTGPHLPTDYLAWAVAEIQRLRLGVVRGDSAGVDDDLNAIRYRHTVASPGPWLREGDLIKDGFGQPVALTGRVGFPSRDPQPWHTADADLIARAHTDIRALLAQIDALRTQSPAAASPAAADHVDDVTGHPG